MTVELQPVLRTRGLTKRFPGVRALSDVDFELRPGEVHVLFGENGAGKSTLTNLLAGRYRPDAGTIEVAGQQHEALTPSLAHELGIRSVFQDFSLVPTLTVQANLMLGEEPGRFGLLDRRVLREGAQQALENLGVTLPLQKLVRELSRSDQQLVEIAKAVRTEARVVILDEPTSALTDHEVSRLFTIVEDLKAQGVGIIYITHRMAEISRIGDRVTVLRDGQYVDTCEVANVTDDDLLLMMTGRPLEAIYPTIAPTVGNVTLELDDVHGAAARGVTLNVRSGEVVGIAGLMGSGKAEVGRILGGLTPRTSGDVRLNGVSLPRKFDPQVAAQHGIIYYPADRHAQGLATVRPVRENITMGELDRDLIGRGPFLRLQQERDYVDRVMADLRVVPAQPERPVGTLSGGNQQKIVWARGYSRPADLHVFHEPTAGVDVGARAELYARLADLAEAGAAVLVISSDLPEVVHLSQRVYVMQAGEVVGELDGDEISEERILAGFFGVSI